MKLSKNKHLRIGIVSVIFLWIIINHIYPGGERKSIVTVPMDILAGITVNNADVYVSTNENSRIEESLPKGTKLIIICDNSINSKWYYIGSGWIKKDTISLLSAYELKKFTKERLYNWTDLIGLDIKIKILDINKDGKEDILIKHSREGNHAGVYCYGVYNVCESGKDYKYLAKISVASEEFNDPIVEFMNCDLDKALELAVYQPHNWVVYYRLGDFATKEDWDEKGYYHLEFEFEDMYPLIIKKGFCIYDWNGEYYEEMPPKIEGVFLYFLVQCKGLLRYCHTDTKRFCAIDSSDVELSFFDFLKFPIVILVWLLLLLHSHPEILILVIILCLYLIWKVACLLFKMIKRFVCKQKSFKRVEEERDSFP
jgi:hypothetical protein